MSVFISTIFLLFSETADGGTWSHIYHEYLNIPGFESWKFLNLIVFLAILWYLLKKPLSEGFKAKREEIRSELIRAEEEKQAALLQLSEVDAKLAQVGAEKAEVIKHAKEESAAEKKRLAEATEHEINRLSEQSAGELTRLSNQTRAELRRFSAEESIRLAEEKLRARIDGPKDAGLVKASIQEIGGLN